MGPCEEGAGRKRRGKGGTRLGFQAFAPSDAAPFSRPHATDHKREVLTFTVLTSGNPHGLFAIRAGERRPRIAQSPLKRSDRSLRRLWRETDPPSRPAPTTPAWCAMSNSSAAERAGSPSSGE
eukprot:scaffold263232_cov32-Tisochrysis_lutea.AAC.3